MWIVTENKFLTPDQIKKLRSYLKKEAKSKKFRAELRWMVIDLALSTGLRCAEMCNLQVEDIHIQEDQCSLHVINGKNGEDGVVLIEERLKKHALKYLKNRTDGPFLLNERGQAYSRGGLQSMVKRIFADVDLPKRFSIHSLRHTMASALYKKTKDIRVVQKQLRHSSISITQVYADVLSSDIKEKMEGLFD